MFLRRINIKKSGKSHYYWALVESYRTERGVRQRIVGYLGDVSGRKAKRYKQAVERCDSCQQDFFSREELPGHATIEPRKTRTERQRQFGGVWLGDKLFEKLGLDAYFSSQIKRGREQVDWPSIFKVLVLSRFCSPSSELHIAEHFYEQAAFEDFLGIPAAKIYDNRLYRGLDKLLPHKDGLETHLKERLGSLFGSCGMEPISKETMSRCVPVALTRSTRFVVHGGATNSRTATTPNTMIPRTTRIKTLATRFIRTQPRTDHPMMDVTERSLVCVFLVLHYSMAAIQRKVGCAIFPA